MILFRWKDGFDKMVNNSFRVLKMIGEKPYLSKEEIAEELDLDKNTVGGIIGKHRKHTRLVKAPSYDQEQGLEWELTGKGYREVHEKLDELEKDLGVDIERPSLHQFKPKHARKKNQLDKEV